MLCYVRFSKLNNFRCVNFVVTSILLLLWFMALHVISNTALITWSQTDTGGHNRVNGEPLSLIVRWLSKPSLDVILSCVPQHRWVIISNRPGIAQVVPASFTLWSQHMHDQNKSKLTGLQVLIYFRRLQATVSGVFMLWRAVLTWQIKTLWTFCSCLDALHAVGSLTFLQRCSSKTSSLQAAQIGSQLMININQSHRVLDCYLRTCFYV